ncbi:hypothetical protein BDV24DRAFT_122218 [Aspergillus arachidicola]|uniref:Uncharacterized protein n=1 Tax=Aspergillus arachidicola TaxID=656916 RepID=A0A5N6YV33_9EURO|nr:hypothetical protein BDV24DRAFT_122218 [Aspergillus arachidicola]
MRPECVLLAPLYKQLDKATESVHRRYLKSSKLVILFHALWLFPGIVKGKIDPKSACRLYSKSDNSLAKSRR